MEFLLISCLAAKAHFVETEAWDLGALARIMLWHSKQQDNCRRSCLESKSVSSKSSKNAKVYNMRDIHGMYHFDIINGRLQKLWTIDM